jgi:hypothetical protein
MVVGLPAEIEDEESWAAITPDVLFTYRFAPFP